MKKIVIAAAASLLFTSCDVAQTVLESIGTSSADINSGLKMALQTGFEEASDSASIPGAYWSDSVGTATRADGDFGWVRDRVIQIALPEDAQKVFDQVETFTAWSQNESVKLVISALNNPVLNKVDELAGSKQELWKSLNSAAETAAPQSKTVFVNAITSMTLADGKAILFPHNGTTAADSLKDSTAATSYLHKTTHTELTEIYSPVVDSALSVVEATQLWESFSTNYNDYKASYTELHTSITNLDVFSLAALLLKRGETMPRSAVDDLLNLLQNGVKDPSTLPTLETDLATYTTGKALDGLFHLVGGEEVKIRRDPVGYISQFAGTAKKIIADVFSLNEDEVQ